LRQINRRPYVNTPKSFRAIGHATRTHFKSWVIPVGQRLDGGYGVPRSWGVGMACAAQVRPACARRHCHDASGTEAAAARQSALDRADFPDVAAGNLAEAFLIRQRGRAPICCVNFFVQQQPAAIESGVAYRTIFCRSNAVRRSVTGSRSAGASDGRLFVSDVPSNGSSRKDDDRSNDLVRRPCCCLRKT
jgi:hypothetical protein